MHRFPRWRALGSQQHTKLLSDSLSNTLSRKSTEEGPLFDEHRAGKQRPRILHLVVERDEGRPCRVGADRAALQTEPGDGGAEKFALEALLDHVAHRHRQKAHGFPHVAASQPPQTPPDAQQIEDIAGPESFELGKGRPVQRRQRCGRWQLPLQAMK